MSELSSLNTSVLFTNWTGEDFTCKWGGHPYHFPAHSSEWISVGTREHNEGLAKHFAKHLTDRELNKRGVPTDHFSRAEFERNCYVAMDAVKSVPVHKVEINKDTGLIANVSEVGREDPKTGQITKSDSKDVTKDMPEQVAPTVEAPETEAPAVEETPAETTEETPSEEAPAVETGAPEASSEEKNDEFVE